jgi:Mn-dependent DtxR family transcriptional regulator
VADADAHWDKPSAADCVVVAKPDLSDAIQDYLREIYKLGVDGGRVSVTALAKRQGVSPASASAMVKKLAALDLAVHQPYRGIALTTACSSSISRRRSAST